MLRGTVAIALGLCIGFLHVERVAAQTSAGTTTDSRGVQSIAEPQKPPLPEPAALPAKALEDESSRTTKTPVGRDNSQDDPLAALRSEIEPLFDDSQERDVIFRTLRDKRELIQRKLQLIDAERRTVLDQLDAFSRQLDPTEELRSVTQRIGDAEAYRDDVKRRLEAVLPNLDVEISERIQRAIGRSGTEIPQSNPQSLARILSEDEIDRIEGDISGFQAVQADLRRLGERKKFLEADSSTFATRRISLESQDQRLAAQRTYLNDKLNEVESNLSRQLFIESEAASYKQWISFFFAFLVFAVIAGFFFIAVRHEQIAVSIFQNQAGLQFITLFSLVIAIILFGVLNILGGKELSALLGAISGYVLGRATSSEVAKQTAEAVATAIKPPAQVPPSQQQPAQSSVTP